MLCQVISKTVCPTVKHLITSTKWKTAISALHPFTFTVPFASCTVLVSFSTTKMLKTQHLFHRYHQYLQHYKGKQDPHEKSIQHRKGPNDLIDNINIKILVKYNYLGNYMDIQKATLFSTNFYQLKRTLNAYANVDLCFVYQTC